MHIDYFLERFKEHTDDTAVIWQDHSYTYADLLGLFEGDLKLLKAKIASPLVVSIEADFSPHAAALLLALIELDCIIVPLTKSVAHKSEEFKQIAQVEASITIDADDSLTFKHEERQVNHELLLKLKQEHKPGLILFSSGSTGKSKAALHDFLPLLEKFKTRRHCLRMLSFLLFDHIGGINTLLYVLSNTGCLITLQARQPDSVCDVIERYHVEALPTSPSFLNLLLLSEAYRRHDLASLKLITYGTEPMPESTLRRLHEILPETKLQQTYGLSEIGIMRSKSRSSDSLWVKIGGEDFSTRVVDGLLEIKARSAMLGYLNAPNPFTADGWFKTGDEVLVDGEYLKILGRRSEMINVGGQKVFPVEVESVIQLMPGVEDVAVRAQANPMLGEIVTARVKLSSPESVSAFKQRLRLFCKGKLEHFKVPQKIELVDHLMTGERFKKMRKA
ncbi:MAG: long-chain fatty acid--CoA ligase [Succinivibrio sp.]|nr:long-chain fatty acid--CoA ligase [Succinivibrio sp.]